MIEQISKKILTGFSRWTDNHIETALNLYPPYFGAGISVDKMTDDLTYVRMKMPLRFYNQNYVGTHFGGSLYSMCDPIYMLMVMKNLGDDFIVWDKSARIDFKKPGRTTVYAEFELPQSRLDKLRKEVTEKTKIEPIFSVDITDKSDDIVATVEKRLYIRRKEDK